MAISSSAPQHPPRHRPLLGRWQALLAATFAAPLAAPLSLVMAYVVTAPFFADPRGVPTTDLQYAPAILSALYGGAFLPCLVAGGVMAAASGKWPILRPVLAWSGIGAVLGILPGLVLIVVLGAPSPFPIAIGMAFGAVCATAYRLVYGLSRPWDA